MYDMSSARGARGGALAGALLVAVLGRVDGCSERYKNCWRLLTGSRTPAEAHVDTDSRDLWLNLHAC